MFRGRAEQRSRCKRKSVCCKSDIVSRRNCCVVLLLLRPRKLWARLPSYRIIRSNLSTTVSVSKTIYPYFSRWLFRLWDGCGVRAKLRDRARQVSSAGWWFLQVGFRLGPSFLWLTQIRPFPSLEFFLVCRAGQFWRARGNGIVESSKICFLTIYSILVALILLTHYT